jgi:hypothetical protein
MMKHKKLYTESPYALEEDLEEDLDEDLEDLEEDIREEETMRIHHVTLMCITILASVSLLLYYNQQDQFIVTSQSQFVAIFDRKHKTLNICSNTDCRMLAPKFDLPSDHASQGILPALASQFMPNMMSSPQQTGYPQQQMMQPQMSTPQGGYPQQQMMQPQGGGQQQTPTQ